MGDQIEMWMGGSVESDELKNEEGEPLSTSLGYEQRSLHIRAKTDGGVTEVIASTTIEDRYGDVVAPPWDLSRIKLNRVCFWGHRYDTPPVGKIEHVGTEGDNLVATIRWDDSPDNPLGQLVARQYREGYLSAVSVGFNPGETTPRRSLDEDHQWFSRGMGNVYRDNELLEISAVGIPANPEALAIRGFPLPDFRPEEVARMVEERVRDSVREDLMSLLAADRMAADAIGRVLGDGGPSPERLAIRSELIRLLTTDTEARSAIESVLIVSPHAPAPDVLADWWTT